MKRPFNLTTFLLISVFSFSQVNFEPLTFEAALQQSRSNGKIIFLQYESLNCQQCNEVANKAFEDKELSEILEQTFICIKISADHPDREKIATLYNRKESGFGSLFINTDGSLVYSYPGSTTFAKTYRDHIDKALFKAGEGLKINEMEKEYKNGNRSPGFMEFFLQARKSLNLETDSLLDEYVSVLPADSFHSVRTLQFIAKMSPDLKSQANIKMRQNRVLFDKAWYLMGLQERISINRQIGYKSIQKAIREKDLRYANQVATFIKNTYNTNPDGAQKAFDETMIKFYLGIKDTLNYLIRALYFYDTYYMTASVDSIKSKDKELDKAEVEKPIVSNEKSTYITRIIALNRIAQMFNRELNNAASSFLKLTKDPLHLNKALEWSARANEFFDNYISLNTHAHLLYMTGKKEEAILWQNKAIALKKNHGHETKMLEAELSSMKNGTFKIQ